MNYFQYLKDYKLHKAKHSIETNEFQVLYTKTYISAQDKDIQSI